MIPHKTIIEEEFQNHTKETTKKFIKYEENWHNGETFKYKNGLDEVEDIRYFQLKTIIEEKDYFVYDEIVQINNKPILFLKLHNDEKREILELIIYLENNNVVQQIRNLNYEQFFNELQNDEDPIKTGETKNTTIIKMSFLEFIESINEEIKEIDLNHLNNPDENISNSTWQKIRTIGLKILLFGGILGVSFGITITTGIITSVPIALGLTAVAGWMALEIVKTVWSNLKNEAMNYIGTKEVVKSIGKSIKNFLGYTCTGLATIFTLGLYKGTYQEKKTQKPKSDKEKIKDLENELQKEKQARKQERKDWFLSLTPDQKQERILNGFQQIWERNKNKDFEILNQELNEKFEKNKKDLAKQSFEKEYEQKMEQWNENWQEKVEFSKSLKPRHVREIKETFKECEENNAIMCDSFFYQPKETWEEFQQEKNMENMEELFLNPKKYDNLKVADIREKSPVKTMKKMVI